MYRTNSSRVLPIIIMVIITIALIVGMIVIGKRLFGGSANSVEQATQLDTVRKDLLTIDAEHSVTMTVRGPLVANENFRSYKINISPDNRQYIAYKGYDDVVSSKKNYGNLTNAYKEFVYALDRADFTKPGKQAGQADIDNTNGICASGRLYTFTIYNGDQPVDTMWTSTCSGSPGTFGASISQVGNLFANQIPGVNLNFGSSQLSL